MLFDLSQDYSKRLAWDPFPESYRFINGTQPAKGLQLEIVAKNGFSMVVEYVSYKRPSVVAIKMVKGPWAFAKFAGSWSFQQISPDSSKVTFKYHIIGAPSWLRPIVTPVINFIFGRSAKRRLSALKQYAETLP
ncbi:Oligoketide cyclase/lipid transport protein [Hahella chejuensis KCTC 2396]|uniref:Oligoketide cyclase/lipid transport protein n=2 Tax=Hahella chejuensis TaxID=158327 RepID=Q2SAV5_HAHCH|nr:Oligoketide cyclase/lipid transport protein [Hahella chejuensis KCTC 2396]